MPMKKEYKRLMTPEDDKFGIFLQDLLDRDILSREDKLEIIKWFDSFDYLTGNETTQDHILRFASRLDW